MKKDIEPKLKLISSYLKTDRELFMIPEYQRAYSWDVEKCDKLWQDVESFIDSGESDTNGYKEPYFFGTIIADCSTDDRISLIDGQQRTTTFILLLKALLVRIQEILSKIKIDDENESLVDGLKDRRNVILDILYKTDADNRGKILKNWDLVKGKTIIESHSINELKEYKQELQTILESPDYNTAEQNCYKIPRRQKDNKYTNFFRNFKFFYGKLKEYHDSQVNIFAKTFLNECNIIEIRSWDTDQAITMFNSLNSTGMPLSDADIISAQMYSHAGHDKKPYMEKWEFITHTASSLSEKKIVNIDSVLQQYMYIRRAEEKVYVRDEGQPDVTVPGLRRYYTIDAKNLLSDPLNLCTHLEKIVKIWDLIKDFTIVKLLLKFNDNAKLYLISYLNRFDVEAITEKTLVGVAESLIKLFSILELVDAGYSSSRFKIFLFGENVRLVDKNIPVEEIIDDFKCHINEEWKKDDIVKLINEYDKNILVYLNEYLFAKEHSLKFVLPDNVNIEHIMPASGHNIETIRTDAKIKTHEDFLSLVNLLGNKILLEEDINKSISNDWFKTKKQSSVKDKKGYKDSGFGIAQSLVNYPKDKWTQKDINDATGKAAERISNFIFS